MSVLVAGNPTIMARAMAAGSLSGGGMSITRPLSVSAATRYTSRPSISAQGIIENKSFSFSLFCTFYFCIFLRLSPIIVVKRYISMKNARTMKSLPKPGSVL